MLKRRTMNNWTEVSHFMVHSHCPNRDLDWDWDRWNWVQNPMASTTVAASVSVFVQCVHLHTILYNLFFIGLGLGHCQCDYTITLKIFFPIVIPELFTSLKENYITLPGCSIFVVYRVTEETLNTCLAAKLKWQHKFLMFCSKLKDFLVHVTLGIWKVMGYLFNRPYKRTMRQKDSRILNKARQINHVSTEFRKNG